MSDTLPLADTPWSRGRFETSEQTVRIDAQAARSDADDGDVGDDEDDDDDDDADDDDDDDDVYNLTEVHPGRLAVRQVWIS